MKRTLANVLTDARRFKLSPEAIRLLKEAYDIGVLAGKLELYGSQDDE